MLQADGRFSRRPPPFGLTRLFSPLHQTNLPSDIMRTPENVEVALDVLRTPCNFSICHRLLRLFPYETHQTRQYMLNSKMLRIMHRVLEVWYGTVLWYIIYPLSCRSRSHPSSG
ncbi:hypothetical protein VFPPC_15208 [Pochonia chlamydosporia 170]|uniref:Uncharacterized protein n=1 Tax=Pochonia chlamydosporia 170 TaxID=1380566 RepID=A0A179G4W9_METCM|nr:hypothetical protein VFPPC_15208 [Pochonia chlamydosporia 170]OAQ72875.1 hypothetical protein VFPPC_15208 [Pochonia chlamydosporia 170]